MNHSKLLFILPRLLTFDSMSLTCLFRFHKLILVSFYLWHDVVCRQLCSKTYTELKTQHRPTLGTWGLCTVREILHLPSLRSCHRRVSSLTCRLESARSRQRGDGGRWGSPRGRFPPEEAPLRCALPPHLPRHTSPLFSPLSHHVNYKRWSCLADTHAQSIYNHLCMRKEAQEGRKEGRKSFLIEGEIV